MYEAARVLQTRVANSGAVVKKWMNRETAFELIRGSMVDEQISDLTRRANLLDKEAIDDLIQIVENKVFSNGISIRGMTSMDLAVDYVHHTYVLGDLTPHYFDPDTEEIYVNSWDESFRIVNNRREPLHVSFSHDRDVLTVLRRISRGAKDGAAGESNPLNNARMMDGTRLAWSCPPISTTSFNLRKHAPPEKVDRKYYIEHEVISEKALEAILAFMLADAAGGIIGEGAVGKSTFLKMMALEMTKVWRRRIIVLERLSELGLRHYFRYHLKSGEYDVLEMEAQPEKSIIQLFTNTKQRAAQVLLQAEVLGGEEVENMKQMYRSGHSAGLFTGHFYPEQFIEGLAGLSAEFKKLDNTSIEERDLRKIINLSIQMESTHQYPRKVTHVWEYGPEIQKPIIRWKGGNQYEFKKIESPTLLDKVERLKYRFPNHHKLLQEVGLL